MCNGVADCPGGEDETSVLCASEFNLTWVVCVPSGKQLDVHGFESHGGSRFFSGKENWCLLRLQI